MVYPSLISSDLLRGVGAGTWQIRINLGSCGTVDDNEATPVNVAWGPWSDISRRTCSTLTLRLPQRRFNKTRSQCIDTISQTFWLKTMNLWRSSLFDLDSEIFLWLSSYRRSCDTNNFLGVHKVVGNSLHSMITFMLICNLHQGQIISRFFLRLMDWRPSWLILRQNENLCSSKDLKVKKFSSILTSRGLTTMWTTVTMTVNIWRRHRVTQAEHVFGCKRQKGGSYFPRKF